MKIKKGFVMRNVAGNNVVISVDSSFVFKGMITLNETAVFMWKLLENGITRENLLKNVLDEYDIDEKTAAEDIDGFIKKLDSAGIIVFDEAK